MTHITLYRATDRSYAEQGDCLTPDRAAATAYTANPGFGGRQLYHARVTVDSDRVLDLRADTEREQMSALADAIGRDVADLAGYGAHVHDAWERSASVMETLAARWTWVRYADDYPEGAETWLYLGADDIDLDEV